MSYVLIMSNAVAKHSAPVYAIAQIDSEGRQFRLTGLGEFRSGLAAREAWRAQPRNGTAYVVELREVSRHGVVYGMTETIVATV